MSGSLIRLKNISTKEEILVETIEAYTTPNFATLNNLSQFWHQFAFDFSFTSTFPYQKENIVCKIQIQVTMNNLSNLSFGLK